MIFNQFESILMKIGLCIEFWEFAMITNTLMKCLKRIESLENADIKRLSSKSYLKILFNWNDEGENDPEKIELFKVIPLMKSRKHR